jgi:hypothetical protein
MLRIGDFRRCSVIARLVRAIVDWLGLGPIGLGSDQLHFPCRMNRRDVIPRRIVLTPAGWLRLTAIWIGAPSRAKRSRLGLLHGNRIARSHA